MKLLSVLFLILWYATFFVALWNADFIESAKKKVKQRWTKMCMVCAVMFSMGYVAVNVYINPPNVKAKNASMKIEIRQKITNGEIISTDTVYVFTPKKK